MADKIQFANGVMIFAKDFSKREILSKEPNVVEEKNTEKEPAATKESESVKVVNVAAKEVDIEPETVAVASKTPAAK
jgi:hypothetical protein